MSDRYDVARFCGKRKSSGANRINTIKRKKSSKRGRLATVVSAILVLPCLLSCAVLVGCDVSKTDGTDKEEAYNTEDFTYKTDISSVMDILNTTDAQYLILVNKTTPLGADYSPSDLVMLNTGITNGGKQIELRSAANSAATAMIGEMRAEGFVTVSITSAYRTYEYQRWLFEHYSSEERAKHPSWSDEQIRAEVLTYSAEPGTSEHQSGLCIDLWDSSCMRELVNYGSETSAQNDKGFAETDAFAWLKDNAHKFGFILRYPEDKTDVTGYSYESWHYRFVGIDAATKIYNQKICFEEYLDGMN